VLSPLERASLERGAELSSAAAFLRLWARKEAVLKAAAVGLAVEPVLVEVSGADEPAEILRMPDSIGPAARYCLVDLEIPGCAAALAGERPLGPVTVLGADAVPPVHEILTSGRLRAYGTAVGSGG
jgi:4'-phosphopantetheinyl transferase